MLRGEGQGTCPQPEAPGPSSTGWRGPEVVLTGATATALAKGQEATLGLKWKELLLLSPGPGTPGCGWTWQLQIATTGYNETAGALLLPSPCCLLTVHPASSCIDAPCQVPLDTRDNNF